MPTFEKHLEESLCRYFGNEKGLELSKDIGELLETIGMRHYALQKMKNAELLCFVAEIGVMLRLSDKEKGMLLDSIGSARDAVFKEVMTGGSQLSLSPEDKERYLSLARELEKKCGNSAKKNRDKRTDFYS